MAMTTFTVLNLKRHLLNISNLVFSMFLPILLFLLFGALQDYGAQMMKHGNVTAYVMVGMAVYGGITAAVSTVGTTVVEQTTGWGRQLALTPMTGAQLLASQCVVILFRAMFPVAAVFITGAITSAEMDASVWVLTFVLSVLVTLPFGLYGMIFGQIFKSDSAVNISSSALVILAFAGNAFMPLPEFLMAFARFTPMYGAVSLARYPLSDGVQAISEAPGFVQDPLWYAVANVVGWTVIFATICLMLNKRQKGRQ
ncbi:ABC transporter permease [Corynebacterium dentalis]|uniref:ABC transporter permease n=1 Tax=Corynebacterium dentalis TaxID=2014528 RepID=UPI00289952B5|nr:ABC transporter permease [Corynebacterium dentalis]